MFNYDNAYEALTNVAGKAFHACEADDYNNDCTLFVDTHGKARWVYDIEVAASHNEFAITLSRFQSLPEEAVYRQLRGWQEEIELRNNVAA